METEQRRVDWIMIALALVIVSSPAIAIVVADWSEGLDVLWFVGMTGMIAGLAISMSRFRSLTSHLLGFVYGLFWIGFLLANPLPYSLWRDKIVILYVRVGGWIALALRGGTGRDTLVFVFVLALLFWWLGYLAVWNTVRYQRVWRAVLPAGLTVLVNTYYYGGAKPMPYLMLYLLCTLLLVVRSYTVLQERRWLSERIGYDSDVRFDLFRSGLVLAVGAILLAWVVPAAASSDAAHSVWQQVEGPWRRVEDGFNRLFSTLRSQSVVYGNPFGRTLTLRGPRNLPDVPVLQVRAPSDKRYYWRGIVYDHYTGWGWISTDSYAVQLEVWRGPKLETLERREEITQTFTVLLPADTLVFAAPQPVRVSLATRADARLSADGVADISQIISARSLTKGATYGAISSLSMADAETLRAMRAAYPLWVRERYLQLPDGLPVWVRKQAYDIAGNLSTPYEKAAAIEAWLRANITYDEKTPGPTEDQDAVAYVLTAKRGYCDYYASAMAVMLRSLGVAARVAVGYAQGKYDPVAGVYNVSQKDSHSWVEVYFPKYGWVEFEPTSSQPVIVRPKPQPVTITPTPESDSAAGPASTRQPRNRPDPEDMNFGGRTGAAQRSLLGPWIWGVVAVAALALGVSLAAWVVERRGLGGLSRTAQAYARLLRFAGWLRVRWSESQTPYERGAAFSRVVPEGDGWISRITDEYTREQYSLVQPGGEEAESVWRKLSPLLWLAGLRLRVQQFQRRVYSFRLWWDALTRRFNRQFG